MAHGRYVRRYRSRHVAILVSERAVWRRRLKMRCDVSGDAVTTSIGDVVRGPALQQCRRKEVRHVHRQLHAPCRVVPVTSRADHRVRKRRADWLPFTALTARRRGIHYGSVDEQTAGEVVWTQETEPIGLWATYELPTPPRSLMNAVDEEESRTTGQAGK